MGSYRRFQLLICLGILLNLSKCQDSGSSASRSRSTESGGINDLIDSLSIEDQSAIASGSIEQSRSEESIASSERSGEPLSPIAQQLLSKLNALAHKDDMNSIERIAVFRKLAENHNRAALKAAESKTDKIMDKFELLDSIDTMDDMKRIEVVKKLAENQNRKESGIESNRAMEIMKKFHMIPGTSDMDDEMKIAIIKKLALDQNMADQKEKERAQPTTPEATRPTRKPSLKRFRGVLRGSSGDISGTRRTLKRFPVRSQASREADLPNLVVQPVSVETPEPTEPEPVEPVTLRRAPETEAPFQPDLPEGANLPQVIPLDLINQQFQQFGPPPILSQPAILGGESRSESTDTPRRDRPFFRAVAGLRNVLQRGAELQQATSGNRFGIEPGVPEPPPPGIPGPKKSNLFQRWGPITSQLARGRQVPPGVGIPPPRNSAPPPQARQLLPLLNQGQGSIVPSQPGPGLPNFGSVNPQLGGQGLPAGLPEAAAAAGRASQAQNPFSIFPGVNLIEQQPGPAAGGQPQRQLVGANPNVALSPNLDPGPPQLTPEVAAALNQFRQLNQRNQGAPRSGPFPNFGAQGQNFPPQTFQGQSPNFPPQAFQRQTPNFPPQAFRGQTPNFPPQAFQGQAPNFPPQAFQGQNVPSQFVARRQPNAGPFLQRPPQGPFPQPGPGQFNPGKSDPGQLTQQILQQGFNAVKQIVSGIAGRKPAQSPKLLPPGLGNVLTDNARKAVKLFNNANRAAKGAPRPVKTFFTTLFKPVAESIQKRRKIQSPFKQ